MFPIIQYEYDDKSYNNDVKITQLVIHIIGYYAIKEEKPDKETEACIELAIKFIEDFPVDKYLK